MNIRKALEISPKVGRNAKGEEFGVSCFEF
jgi:hypothetical protein